MKLLTFFIQRLQTFFLYLSLFTRFDVFNFNLNVFLQLWLQQINNVLGVYDMKRRGYSSAYQRIALSYHSTAASVV